jgi:CBS domain-containing protein
MGLKENLLREQVKDLPLREALTATEETLVTTALARMHEKRLGCVIVVDAGGKPLGMFTERTLIELLLRESVPWDTLRVRDCLDKEWYTVPSTASVMQVLDLIRVKAVRFVCVVDEAGRAVGLTGQKGLSEYIADHFPRQVLVQRLGGKLGPENREGA